MKLAINSILNNVQFIFPDKLIVYSRILWNSSFLWTSLICCYLLWYNFFSVHLMVILIIYVIIHNWFAELNVYKGWMQYKDYDLLRATVSINILKVWSINPFYITKMGISENFSIEENKENSILTTLASNYSYRWPSRFIWLYYADRKFHIYYYTQEMH